MNSDQAGKPPIKKLTAQELELETDRLILRPLQLADIDLGTALFTDPQVVKYVCDLCTQEEIEENFKTETRRGAGGRIGIWTLTRKETGGKIGSAILLPLPIEKDDTDWSLLTEDTYPDAEIEVGYMLIPSAWGFGYATEACQRLVRFGFEMTTLDEIKATADPENLASHRVLQKSGLKHEGLRYAYNCQCSSFGITRDEWLTTT